MQELPPASCIRTVSCLGIQKVAKLHMYLLMCENLLDDYGICYSEMSPPYVAVTGRKRTLFCLGQK